MALTYCLNQNALLFSLLSFCSCLPQSSWFWDRKLSVLTAVRGCGFGWHGKTLCSLCKWFTLSASPSFWYLTAQGVLWWARLAENPSIHTGSCWAVTEECGGIRHVEMFPLQEQWFGHTLGCLQWPEMTSNPQEFNQGLSQGLRMTQSQVLWGETCVCVSLAVWWWQPRARIPKLALNLVTCGSKGMCTN